MNFTDYPAYQKYNTEYQPSCQQTWFTYLTFIFHSEERKIIAKSDRELKNGEISVLLGQTWRAMSNAEKKPFEDQASILLELHKAAKRANPEAFK